jgi:hypothetical protein
MPNLRDRWTMVPFDSSVHDETTANAAADCHIEYPSGIATSPECRFGQGCHVAIIVDGGWNLKSFFQVSTQRKTIPTVDLMALRDTAAAHVDGAAKPNAHARHGASITKLGAKSFNLLDNSVGTSVDIDISSTQLDKLVRGTVSYP